MSNLISNEIAYAQENSVFLTKTMIMNYVVIEYSRPLDFPGRSIVRILWTSDLLMT